MSKELEAIVRQIISEALAERLGRDQKLNWKAQHAYPLMEGCGGGGCGGVSYGGGGCGAGGGGCGSYGGGGCGAAGDTFRYHYKPSPKKKKSKANVVADAEEILDKNLKHFASYEKKKPVALKGKDPKEKALADKLLDTYMNATGDKAKDKQTQQKAYDDFVKYLTKKYLNEEVSIASMILGDDQ